MATVETAMDREALADWYRRNRERSRTSSTSSGRGVSLAADRAPPPDRVLRGPPAGVQLQHAREARRSAGRASTSASSACSRAASIRTDEAAASGSQRGRWPSRDEVRRFADECDARVLDALANAPLEQPGHPLLHEAQAVYTILEHEAMHQETLLYMWHRLPSSRSGRRPALR